MELSLCPYKYLFGEPNKGIHKYRLFDISIFDVIVTILIAFFFSEYFKINFYEITIALFLLGIIIHRIFCIKTTVDKIIFYD